MAAPDPISILGPGGNIARKLPAYEHRTEQLEMARAVTRAIERPGHLVVEAGTGVGKSFAYLVPAIQAAVELKKKVVVSTHTIALQEQLLNKDIPFLRSVMKDEFTAVLVKGRSNYISLRRLNGAVERQDAIFQRPEEHDQLATVRMWSNRTTDGSRSDLSFRPLPAVWEAVQSEDGNCLGRKCPSYNDCFFYRARRRAQNANILIVNHALFVTDLALRASGISNCCRNTTWRFSTRPIRSNRSPASTWVCSSPAWASISCWPGCPMRGRNKGLLGVYHLDAAIHQVQRARATAEDFFARIEDWYHRQPAGFNGRVRAPLGVPEILPEELRKLASAIQRRRHGNRAAGKANRAGSGRVALPLVGDGNLRLAPARGEATAFTGSRWSTRARTRIKLASAPLDVGPSLRRLLFDRVPTCVLTSATLCVGSPPKFDFIKSRLGLTSCEALALGSPFDYASQVTVHLPSNLPDPADQPDLFERRAIRAIAHYLEQTEGKAFVLFTSHKMLEAAARALTPWLAQRNIALFAQSDGMPRSKMVDAFKADINSVIFGADTFWQGVDVPGESLSNVIITRLPFSVPSHPLLEARLEDIRRRGGSPFVEYQVPEAVIKLKQGFGRLIRTRTDRGIVVILDPRVLSKPYGRTFLNSLPQCPRIVEAPSFGDASH